ncbi:MAG: acyl-CoA dehydrogenase family protein, partial [candidate division WOR-3 bacterium]
MQKAVNEYKEEGLILETVKKLVQEYIKAQAQKIDQRNEFPFDLVERLRDMGLFGIPFPEDYGGIRLGYLTFVKVLEELSKGLTTAAAIVAVNSVVAEAIFRFGTKAQKEKYLKSLLNGELGSILFTEAATGSDPEAIRTNARKVQDGFILNGEKLFVSLAPASKIALVFANCERRLSAFLVETSSPGYRVEGRPYDTLGLRGLGVCTVVLHDVFVPSVNLLGEEGKGFEILLEIQGLARLAVA